MTTPGVSHLSATTVEDFRRVLDERSLQPGFQPLIDLDSRHVLGYESLARGRRAGPPLTLFVNAEPVSLAWPALTTCARPSSGAWAGCGWWSR